jgi:hypothetical protein
MSPHSAMQLPASGSGVGLAASWTFSSERAVMLGAQSGGFLHVDKGTVWLTLDGPHQGPANDWGDLVLRSGTRIHLTAGQHVVLEPYQRAANEPTGFSWEPDAFAADADAPAGPMSAGWRRTGAMLVRLARALGQWLAPAPTWPAIDPALELERATQSAWRSLYHLRGNPP